MLETIVDLLVSCLCGTMFAACAYYFWTGARTHRANEAVHREHAEAHRQFREAIERALREDT